MVLFFYNIPTPTPTPTPLSTPLSPTLSPTLSPNLIPYCDNFFKTDYESARNLFKFYSIYKGADLDELLIQDNNNNEYFIDIAVFYGKKNEVLLHISGTHGVEGYTGSAIQSYILKDYVHNKNGPTVIMVHGLNPFGMKNLRRVNENNVDLNRNALFSDIDWELVNKREINLTNSINEVINPVELYFINYLRLFYKVLIHGFINIKRAIVTGTYTNKNSIFYGGNTLQKSHIKMQNFLKYWKKIDKLVLIDIHTGLGPLGRDTIMLSTETNSTNSTKFKNIFKDAHNVLSIHNGVESYELTMGNVADNYPKLFPFLDKSFTMSLTQEFGTYNNIKVGLSLIKENMKWTVKNDKSLDYNFLETFCPNNSEYRNNVLKRGTDLFYNSLIYFNN